MRALEHAVLPLDLGDPVLVLREDLVLLARDDDVVLRDRDPGVRRVLDPEALDLVEHARDRVEHDRDVPPDRVEAEQRSDRPRPLERGVVGLRGRERRLSAAQDVLQHLARRVARERVGDELHVLRDLEVGEVLPAVIADVLGS